MEEYEPKCLQSPASSSQVTLIRWQNNDLNRHNVSAAGYGYNVQPYKVGLDFIDPSYILKLTGRYSRKS